MPAPRPASGLPEHDTIVSSGPVASWMSNPAPELQALSWPGAVWLAPDACLIRSHLQPTEQVPVVVHIVGVSDHGDWAGAVLILN